VTLKATGDLAEGTTLGRWTLVERIGRGGNSQVWSAQNSAGEIAALKVLMKNKSVAYQRFCDEALIMKNCGVAGVVPILEEFLPEWPTDQCAWYAMPVGVSLIDYLSGSGLAATVSQFVRVANVLVELHSQGITHRDIKPANIIVIDDRACLGDFGLVDYPDKADLTGFREELGPRWTMAPEIRRHEHNGDTRPADVFSLAKSLWIAITRRAEGFDGRYDGSGAVSIKPYVGEAFVGPLEELLMEATEHEPVSRPGMREFRDRLVSWLGLHSDFSKINAMEWKYAQKKLFPIGAPRHAEWHDIEDIVSVLNIVGPKTNLNHLFFPTGGGLDLERAMLSHNEQGCIELVTDGLISILKPKSLQFEGFGAGEEWDYLRLECAVLKPSGVYEESRLRGYGYEEVLDLGGGQYVDRSYWDYGEFNGEPLPDGAKPISRYFEGAFVIFQKTSTYNRISATYDGRHSKMSAAEFRRHIEEMISDVKAYMRTESPNNAINADA
jgi:serine/threonine protein kinase